ncbi:hypothetical protein N8K70_14675 [Microbacterium betulae]|uniref:Uncharacterized protein n=1 Tax=Microbacterium betulae TaxID=2981139 RepID=A0AA97I6P1_9MICO|nr:hypothetical protein [Microbacterium sp. AB]WOF22620.1 hypothetical protein N8K70_14675 [Microbacterium sp. AB]
MEHVCTCPLGSSIQSALWNSGHVHAAGSRVVLIAGYAITNDAT